MELIFLGTAGSVMTKNWGFPSILINEDLLLDCGEGTTQKLLEINKIENLNTICITHLHADHFLGLISLLWHLWIQKRKKKLIIYGPLGIRIAVNNILKLVNTPPSIKTFEINLVELNPSSPGEKTEGRYSIKYFPVDHGIPALSYRITQNGCSIFYTGDSKPIQDFERFAYQCQLLISEATFPSKFNKYAHQQYHMTPSDAAKVAKNAKCQKLVLTHISSYFLKYLDSFQAEAERIFKNEVIIAQDFKKLSIP